MSTSNSKNEKEVSGPLSPSELGQIRRILLEKRQDLADAQENHLSELSDPGDRHHLADLEEMSSDSNEMQSLCEIMGIGDATVAQIDAALERIAEGTYGICLTCGNPIPRLRLEALPFAGLCVNCQRQEELKAEA